MGTTNRAFTPSLHKAMMLNNANSTGRKYHANEKVERVEKKHTPTFFNRVKSMVTSFFRFFGFGRGRLQKAYCFPVATFSTPTHSRHNCGHRTVLQNEQRKLRRQKRTKLIMRRGYA